MQHSSNCQVAHMHAPYEITLIQYVQQQQKNYFLFRVRLPQDASTCELQKIVDSSLEMQRDLIS